MAAVPIEPYRQSALRRPEREKTLMPIKMLAFGLRLGVSLGGALGLGVAASLPT